MVINLTLGVCIPIMSDFPIKGGMAIPNTILGGETSNIFGIFSPIPGEDFQFDEHIFQMA